MRWTEEAEKILWQTVFRTHAFTLELEKISKEWPGDERPTPKALKEHLAKWRKELGSDCQVKFNISSKSDCQGGSSAPVTPRKKVTPKKAAGEGATATLKKRSRQSKLSTPVKGAIDDEEEDKKVKMEDTSAGVEDGDAEAEADDEESDDLRLKKVKMEIVDEEI
ncbi:hypothetical protein BDW74DRAFT_178561 [Aspergillus multicolor]|uniref:uncharacterized protein n=1 Tax=Aspergillus multicolor TaxID=41759 RepID=UPI003CCCFC94